MTSRRALAFILGLTWAGLGGHGVLAQSGALAPLDGRTIAERINAREDGRTLRETMTMTLTARSGATRTRKTTVMRADFDGVTKTMIRFDAPTNVKGTAFLSFDYDDADQSDDRWLYLPAMRRVRRISAADRGDYFLGTDFTYQDIEDSTKFSLSDYIFNAAGTQEYGGITCHALEITAKTPDIAKELGYSRVRALVDPSNWMPVHADYWDLGGNHLKTVELSGIMEVQGIWTATRMVGRNHKTGHSTELVHTDMVYDEDIGERRFNPQALGRKR